NARRVPKQTHKSAGSSDAELRTVSQVGYQVTTTAPPTTTQQPPTTTAALVTPTTAPPVPAPAPRA
ncbi:hypothetical protein, partial [Mycobacterium riyadhense]